MVYKNVSLNIIEGKKLKDLLGNLTKTARNDRFGMFVYSSLTAALPEIALGNHVLIPASAFLDHQL